MALDEVTTKYRRHKVQKSRHSDRQKLRHEATEVIFKELRSKYGDILQYRNPFG